MLTGCAVVWAWGRRGRPVAPGMAGWMAWALAVCVLLSAAMAHHPWIAAREVTVAAGLIVFALAIRDALSEQRLRMLLTVLAATAFGYGLVVYVPLVLAVSAGATIYTYDLVVGFDNPRFLNHCQSVAIPLLILAATWRPVRPLQRWVALIAATMACGILGFCNARASVLATLAATLVPLIILGRRAFRFSFTLLLVLAIGGIGMTYVAWDWPRTLDEFTSIEALTQLNFRNYLIRHALQLWWSAPWLGVGPMHFADSPNSVAAHPHNAYLQILCEYGVFAAGLVLALLCRAGWSLLRVTRAIRLEGGSDSAQNELAAAMVGTMAAVLVDALFSGSFVMPLSQLWCAMAIGMAAWFHRAKSGISPGVAASGLARSSAARWVVCLALLLLSLQSLQELMSLPVPALLTAEQPSVPRGLASRNPRFWEHGWF